MDLTALATTSMAALAQITRLSELFVHERDEVKLRALRTELLDQIGTVQGKLLELQRAAFSDLETIADLRAQLRSVAEATGERSAYEWRSIGQFNARVYARKDETTPTHLLCAACFDSNRRSVFQESDGGKLLRCLQDSGHNLRLAKAEQLRVRSLSRIDPTGY